MAKATHHVHCTSPNASHLINGVAFGDHEDGGVRTSEPVSEDVAERFNGIPGYTIVAVKEPAAAPAKPPAAAPQPVAKSLI